MRFIVLSVILISSCSDNESKFVLSKSKQKQEQYLDQILKLSTDLDEVKKSNYQMEKAYDSLIKLTQKTYKMHDLVKSIKEHVGIIDSIELIGFQQYGRQELMHTYAFVDFNLNSKYHNLLTKGYAFYNEDDRKQYESYLSNHKTNYELDESILSKYVGNWTPIYKYRNEFYNYLSLCEFRNIGFSLSDSTYIHYYMDGLFPKVLTGINENGNLIEFQLSKSTYTLELIDLTRSIYIITEGKHKEYVIPQSAIKNFPIIVEECHDQ